MSSRLEEVLGKKWSLELLRLLDRKGEQNFNAMQDELDISSSTLTETKVLLVEYGLIGRNELKRTDVRYELTGKGEMFLEKIGELERILESGSPE